ncbi:response regulator [Vibrio sp. 10N.261.55.A7]|uniref:GGDEF domain-containing response regulator n=1 Tax=Vibrio sp. 10N.261.55.A7 TaxID=1880851 RepID=UPI000C82A973|nr:response regulator [Vibrio sp. 10N.261.55.A7]PMJ90174.1 diguanylate cyclase response regulator [Vibrio sp. 10N.261.55.A7]
MSSKILIVEDSRAFRNYLYSLLSDAGYDVYTAESIEDARTLLNQKHDFLCAVLDYCLPDGQDGEIIDLVLDYQYKVIVLTAMFQEEIRERVIAKGVLDYILKDSMSSVSYLLPLVNRLTNNRDHRALVVDDSKVVRRHIGQLLEGQYINVIQAEDGQQAIDVLKQNPDITFVITDHDMPIKDGISMIREIRIQHDKNDLAILGLSGSDDRTMTARYLKAGANDFLHKPFNQEEFFCRVHQILDMKEATGKLYRLANEDALTGLWNRRYLFQHFDNKSEFQNIAMLDIDFFKKVNDNYGHDGGDAALVTLSQILKLYFSDDVVVRFGGEEFCIQSNSSTEEFITRLEHMRKRIETTIIPHLDHQITITVSIGVSNIEASLEEQIKLADDRLYQAKENGRNRIVS